MGKGILLEVEGRRGVVLTPQGEFRRVPLPKGSFDIGDEVAYQERPTMRWGWVAAAAALLLALLSPVGYQQWALAQPMALMMIEINPSLQLTLNGRDQVIQAVGLNSDGEAILTELDWAKRPADEVARAITAQAVAAGKLDPSREEGAVVMAFAPAGTKELAPEKAQALLQRSKEAVQQEVVHQAEAKGSEPKAQVAAIEGTAQDLQEASAQGLTLPKWAIYREIQAEHPEVTVESFKAVPPGQLMKELKINPSEIFSQAEHHRQNEKKEKKEKKEQVAPTTAPGKQKDDKATEPQGNEPPAKPQENKGPGQGHDGNGNGNNGNGNHGNGHGNDKIPPGQEKKGDQGKPNQAPKESQGNGKSQGKLNKGSDDDEDDPAGEQEGDVRPAPDPASDSGRGAEKAPANPGGNGKGKDSAADPPGKGNNGNNGNNGNGNNGNGNNGNGNNGNGNSGNPGQSRPGEGQNGNPSGKENGNSKANEGSKGRNNP